MHNNSRSATKATSTSRLKQDYMRLKRDPVPYITAEPLPQNILEWHYVVQGPEDTPYCGGYYHGTLVFPHEFPFKPPAIYMLTPNGRFRTNTRLCLSISDYHPDTWNPAWSVATILTGLLSFMLESTPMLGSTESSQYEREQLARNSLRYNLQNETFRELFPDVVTEMNRTLAERKRVAAAADGGGPISARMKRNALTGQTDGIQTRGGGGGGGGGGGDSDAGLWRGGGAAAVDGSTWQSLCSNVLVLVAFGLFALIVNHVVKNLNHD